jgi:hypothetical protein
MQRRRLSSACLVAVAALTAAIAIGGLLPAQAENSAISMRRAAERTSFSNEEIKDGLFKTAFRAELQLGRHDERIRKFEEPVRVFVEIMARLRELPTLRRSSTTFAPGFIISIWP